MCKKLTMIFLAIFAAILLAACGESSSAAMPDETDGYAAADMQEQDGVYEPNYGDKKTMLEAAEATEPISADAGTVGSMVPDFALHTYDGGTFGTADMQGKVTLLIFWFPT